MNEYRYMGVIFRPKRRAALVLFAAAILVAAPLRTFGADWSAGAATVVITPEQPMWMAGYGSRSEPADGTETELYAKALVLRDGAGEEGVIITLDLVGIGREFAMDLCQRLEKEYGLERRQIALATSHTHSGPVVAKNLGPLHYWVISPEQQKLVDEYAVVLTEAVVKLVGDAYEKIRPARLQSGSGQAIFAVNRRNNRPEGDVPDFRARGRLEGPVDHDVPVLSVRDEDDRLVAILFGYACHSTTLSFQQWNGDYPGYAQMALEEQFPGAVALFWAGCGGDQNPLPRRELSLAEHYGGELAAAVVRALESPMPDLDAKLTLHWQEFEAPLSDLPTRKALQEEENTSTNRFEVARARYLLREMDKKGDLDSHYPFPIGHWTLGDRIDFIFLGGEVVVDYAIRLKRERRGTETWVAAYANDVMAYIPSLRVLREGGYEGGGSNVYYGLPTLWDELIEEAIVGAVPPAPGP